MRAKTIVNSPRTLAEARLLCLHVFGESASESGRRFDNAAAEPASEHRELPTDELRAETSKRRVQRAARERAEREDRSGGDIDQEFDRKLRLEEIRSWLKNAGIPSGLLVELSNSKDGRETIRFVTRHGTERVAAFPGMVSQVELVALARGLAEQLGFLIDEKRLPKGDARLQEIRRWLKEAGIPSGLLIEVARTKDGQETINFYTRDGMERATSFPKKADREALVAIARSVATQAGMISETEA